MEITTTTKTAKDLLGIALNAKAGMGMMHDANKQMKQAREQWAKGALLAGEALYTARMLHKDDISFGDWCNANGLGESRISRNDRAALIKIGADLDYYREALMKTDSWSLRLIVKQDQPPGVSQAVIPLPRHKTPPGPKSKAAPQTDAPSDGDVAEFDRLVEEGRKVVADMKAAPQTDLVRSATPPPDHIQNAADNAESATLKKELIDARAEIERLQRRLEAEQQANAIRTTPAADHEPDDDALAIAAVPADPDAQRILKEWNAAVRAIKAAVAAAERWFKLADTKGTPQNKADLAKRDDNKLCRISEFHLDVFSASRMSRPGRWTSCLAELREVLDEFAGWRSNLPENFQWSPLAEKLDAMADFEDQLSELENADLPRGFGND
jgi:hypothetical protein